MGGETEREGGYINRKAWSNFDYCLKWRHSILVDLLTELLLANPADKIPSVDIVANKTSEKLSQNAIYNFLENCKFVIAASQSVS